MIFLLRIIDGFKKHPYGDIVLYARFLSVSSHLQNYRTPKIMHCGEYGSYFRLFVCMDFLTSITFGKSLSRPPNFVYLVNIPKIGLNKSRYKVCFFLLTGLKDSQVIADGNKYFKYLHRKFVILNLTEDFELSMMMPDFSCTCTKNYILQIQAYFWTFLMLFHWLATCINQENGVRTLMCAVCKKLQQMNEKVKRSSAWN